MAYDWLRPEYRKKIEERAAELKSAGFRSDVVDQSLGTSSTSTRSSTRRTGGGHGASPEPAYVPTPSPQETAPTPSAGQASIEKAMAQPSSPQDEIRAGPGAGPIYGLVGPGTTAQELMQESPSSMEERIEVPSLSERGGMGSPRAISIQETMSTESELMMARERARGMEEINIPYEQSKRVSELIVGPVENIPKTETAPRALATAVDLAVMLPAETLRTPITVSEVGGELVKRDVITTFELPGPTKARVPGVNIGKAAEYTKEEVIDPIVKDPAGAGVRAGLTAGLILLPAARVVRGRSSGGAPGRTTSYEVTVPEEAIPKAARIDVISDITYEPIKGSQKGGIKSTGTVKVNTKSAMSFLEVSGETVPEGSGFRTTLQARRATRSKVDLTEISGIKGDIFTKESGKVTTSRSTFLGEDVGRSSQLDLLGKPQPRQELTFRTAAERQVSPDLDVGIGGSSARQSIMNMAPRESVDIYGRRLVLEERAGPTTRRVTYTKEALIDPKTFEQTMKSDIAPPGYKGQDTLSFNLKIGKARFTPEEALQAGIESGVIKFEEVSRFKDPMQLGEFAAAKSGTHGRIRILKRLTGEKRTATIAHEIGHFMQWSEGNFDITFAQQSAYGKLMRARSKLRQTNPRKLEAIERRMDRDPKFAKQIFERAMDYGWERMELRAKKFEEEIMKKGGFRPNALGKVTLQANRPSKPIIATERAIDRMAASFADINPPSPPAEAPAVLKTKPKSGGIRTRSPSPGPILLKGNIPMEELEIIRYPPLEGPKTGRQPMVNAPDMALKPDTSIAERVADSVASVVRQRSRTRSSSRTTLGLQLNRAQTQEQGLGMLSAQAQELRLSTGQRTRQRQDTVMPLPGYPRISGRFSPLPTPRITPRGGFFAPPIIPIRPGPSRSSRVGMISPPMSRRFGYGPSLAGLASGVSIEAAPSRVTGLEIRPPVRRKKRRR